MIQLDSKAFSFQNLLEKCFKLVQSNAFVASQCGHRTEQLIEVSKVSQRESAKRRFFYGLSHRHYFDKFIGFVDNI